MSGLPTTARTLLAAAVTATILVVGTPSTGHAAPPPPRPAGGWWDESATATARARELLGRMTLAEKVDMLHGEQNNLYGFFNAPIPRLGIPALTMADGPLGVRIANPAVNGQRSTELPGGTALAATFSARAAATFGDVAGDEAFRTGHNVWLAPAVDIARHPQAGRIFEAFGEEPLLTGTMAASVIAAAQRHPVVADIKHYQQYNQETNRLSGGNAVVGERALREIYTRPFEIGIRQGHPGSAMCSFNALNGTQACGNALILNEILKTQLEFQGWVMSDYGATHATSDILAGLDQEQPGDTSGGPYGDAGTCFFCQPLIDAVRAGRVPMSRVDDAVLRILRPMFGLGLFDHPVQISPIPEAEHGAVARNLAREGMVLLKNTRRALPLPRTGLGSIAVIGRDADYAVQGGGSSVVIPTYTVGPLQGIRRQVGAGVHVTYTPGNDPVTAAALLPGPPPVPSSVLSPTPGSTQRGLQAQYWANTNFSGSPLIDRVEPNVGVQLGFVNFPGFGANSPHAQSWPTSLNSAFSARWTGTITAPATDRYRLSVTSIGTARLYLDDQLLATSTAVRGRSGSNTVYAAGTTTATVPLTAGSRHSVRIEYVTDVPLGTEPGPAVKFGWAHAETTVAPQIQAAVRAARRADAAVVVVRDYETEGSDRPSLDLPYEQDQLIRRVAAVNPRTIVVLQTGAPVQTSTWQGRAAAILQSWYGGQEQGNAAAELLFGRANPSGKTPITWPINENTTPVSSPEQFPGINGTAVYREGIFVGYRGYDALRLPVQYPFGYGLSYTTFGYSRLAAGSWNRRDATGPTVALTLRDTGRRAGTEVVQVYVGRLPGAQTTPPKQLAGWARVAVTPGHATRVGITLDPRSLSYWDTDRHAWVTPTGTVRLYVGSSSRDIRLTGSLRVR